MLISMLFSNKNCKNLLQKAFHPLFAVFLICPFIYGQKNKSSYDNGNGTYQRNYNKVTYSWSYTDEYGNSHDFSFFVNFNRGWDYMQDVYKRMNHDHGNYNRFIRNDPFKADLVVIAEQLRDIANTNEINEVYLALSFIQALPYQSNMKGYQRYAVETLIDAKGDCSDTAVLFAGILAAWNYDCIFLDFPNHLAVGVWAKSIPGGSYFEYRGRRYFFCETTGTGWKIGEGADDYPRTENIEEVSFD